MSGHRPPHRRGERPQGKRPSPNTPLPPHAEKRLRELESQEDPLSLAEEISKESRFSAQELTPPNRKSDARPSDQLSLAELQRLSDEQLSLQAAKEHVETTGLQRRDVIFQILKLRLKNNGLMFGEGTLEILPDGFGFSEAAAPSTSLVQTTSTFRPARFGVFACRQEPQLPVRFAPRKKTSGTLLCCEWRPSTITIRNDGTRQSSLMN
jgi:hypothetical protein